MSAEGAISPSRAKLRTLLRLFRAAWRGAPLSTALLYSGTALQGLGAAAEVWALGRLVDALTRAIAGPAPASALTGGVVAWLLVLIGLRLAASTLGGGIGWLQARVREAQEGVASREILRKAARLPLVQFETAEFYDHLTRATLAIHAHWFFDISWRSVSLIENAFSLTGLIWVAGRGHWLVPVVVIGAGIVVLRVQRRYYTDHYVIQRGTTPEARRVNYLGSLLTSRATAKEVRLFDLGRYFVGRWEREHRALRAKLLRHNVSMRLRLAVTGLLPILAFGIALGLVLFRLPSGALTVGDAVSVLYAVMRLQESWSGFRGLLMEMWNFYLHAIGDLAEFLALAEPSQDGKELPAGAHTIEVDRVSFTYPGSTRPALRNVSFTIRPGEKIALVGENGSGKTTLVQLLFGFFEPSSGAVRYDGLDTRVLNPASLWRQAAAVFQDFVEYHLTLRENIGFGRVDRLDDNAAIRQAAHKGGAGELLGALPDGPQTMLGPTFDGRDVSKGQWQRIATARAFMRDDDAHLLVLDEPTAALDPRAEVEVYRRFQAMAGDRTAILISHRMGFARLADRIFVLKDGELVEVGTHAELMAAGGEYAELFATQAKWYV